MNQCEWAMKKLPFFQFLSALLSLNVQFSGASIPKAVTLNLDEINLVQYDIKISDKPILIDAPKDNSENLEPENVIFLPMTNKYGQKYQCQVPKPKNDEEKSEDGENESKTENAEQFSENLSDLEKAKKVLEPMRTQSCLLRTKDWWTYEFCYGKHIRQFHMEDGKPSGPILILGFFDRDLELEDEKLENGGTSNKVKRHHSQIFTNGSQCDLTGNPRSTEVRVRLHN